MSVFRYDSRHKVVVGAIVIITSATLFYLRDHEKPSFENGQTKQVGSQVDGRNHGMWIWYYPSGKKKIQGSFEHGEREGVWITFSESGDTLIKANYLNDKLNGRYTVYGAQNQIEQTIFYKDDRLKAKGQP